MCSGAFPPNENAPGCLMFKVALLLQSMNLPIAYFLVSASRWSQDKKAGSIRRFLGGVGPPCNGRPYLNLCFIFLLAMNIGSTWHRGS